MASCNRLALPVLLLLAVASVLSTGCASAGPKARLGRFEPDTTASLAVAPETGVYTLMWIGGDERTPPVDVTQRIVRAGGPLGFTRADDGTVIARAGDETFPIADEIPTDTGRLVWHTRGPEEGADVGHALSSIVHGAGTVGLVAGAVVLKAIVEGGDDDDDLLTIRPARPSMRRFGNVARTRRADVGRGIAEL